MYLYYDKNFKKIQEILKKSLKNFLVKHIKSYKTLAIAYNTTNVKYKIKKEVLDLKMVKS